MRTNGECTKCRDKDREIEKLNQAIESYKKTIEAITEQCKKLKNQLYKR